MAKKNTKIASKTKAKGSSTPFFKKWLILLFLWGLAFATLFSFGFYYVIANGWIGDVPSEKQLREIQNYTASEVYSTDGILLGKYFIEDRTNVAFEEISESMINALIATEDARFYEHQGIDKIGLMRVLVKSVLLGNDNAGGGSTLSQQLVKNIFPRKKYWLLTLPINKMKEAITAQKLEEIFSKKEILTLYLNTVPFGENAYGVESASKRYFNTSAKKLSIAQSALLVGMLKATNNYNPRKYHQKALQRRNTVIQQMLKYQYISPEVAKKEKAKPIQLDFQPVAHSKGLAPYFREYLRLELHQWCNEHQKPDGKTYNLYTDGLKIYTSINSKMQLYAEQAVIEQMNSLQSAFDAHWKNQQSPWGNNTKVLTSAIHRSEPYKYYKNKGLSEKEILAKLNIKNKMEVFGYQGKLNKNWSSIDSIKYYLKFLHAGFFAIEPNTGMVRAWVGGINHEYFQYDHVNKNTKRQVGSTFKPIVYATALERGTAPCEHFENVKLSYSNYNDWSPSNADNIYGGYYSMKGALTKSINTISAQLIMRAGINHVIELAKNMGIESELAPIPSIALGSADISLFEMTNAYAVFANKGFSTKPQYLISIEDQNGKIIFKPSHSKYRKKVIASSTADLMVEMMKNVVNEGTAERLRSQYGIYCEVAGKTGTTQSQADGWFIGFTPKLLAGAWVGAEDRRIHFRTTTLGQGANTALPIWGRFFAKLSKDPSLSKYLYSSFSPLSPELVSKIDCEDYLPPKDSLNFLQKIFGTKPNIAKKELPPAVKEKSPKYQNTWSKIRNMFRRNKDQ
ncbi:MAG: penicillin-binding protein [Cytophagales bacterium]|nr:MAG: penicillin-binding protein [Cytophagales bacterium]